MALALIPATLSQRQLLMGYLNDALDAETSAWFEAWLLTQQPLIELLDRYNDARDELNSKVAQVSRRQDAVTVGKSICCRWHTAAPDQLCRQHVSAAARLLGPEHCSEACHHRGCSRCTVEKVARPYRSLWVGFAPGANDIGSWSHAKHFGTGVTPERVVAHPASQIQRADGQNPGTRRRILDAVLLPVTVAGCRDHQRPVATRQPRQRARQHARRRVPGAIESQTQGNDVSALGQRPGASQFDCETVTATIVFDDLGNQQARIGGNAITTTAIKGPTRPGDDAGAGRAVAVRAAILDRAGPHQRDAAGNPVTAKIRMAQIDSAVENSDAHAGAGRSVGVQPQSLRRQHPWAWVRRHAVPALSPATDAFGTIHAQGPMPDLTQQLPAAELDNEHRAQRRHKQRGAVAAPEPVADQVLDQLSPTGRQFCHLSRRKA